MSSALQWLCHTSNSFDRSLASDRSADGRHEDMRRQETKRYARGHAPRPRHAHLTKDKAGDGAGMDHVMQFIEAYGSPAASSADTRLDLLIDLERLRDPRILPFLLNIVVNSRESPRCVAMWSNSCALGGRRGPTDHVSHMPSSISWLRPPIWTCAFRALYPSPTWSRSTAWYPRSASSHSMPKSRWICVTPRSPRSSEPDRPLNASVCCAHCRRMKRSVTPPETCFRPGAPNEAEKEANGIAALISSVRRPARAHNRFSPTCLVHPGSSS